MFGHGTLQDELESEQPSRGVRGRVMSRGTRSRAFCGCAPAACRQAEMSIV